MFVLLPRCRLLLLPVSACLCLLCPSTLKLNPDRETKHKTLEEIAAAFGDKVVLLTETELAAEDEALDHKVDELRVERAPENARV